MAVPKLVVLQGRFGAVIKDEGEHLSLLSLYPCSTQNLAKVLGLMLG